MSDCMAQRMKRREAMRAEGLQHDVLINGAPEYFFILVLSINRLHSQPINKPTLAPA